MIPDLQKMYEINICLELFFLLLLQNLTNAKPREIHIMRGLRGKRKGF